MCEPDDALLAQATAGDMEAVGRLLKRHVRTLRGTLAGKIPRRWQSVLSVEDVLQQTFADAVRDIRGFSGTADGEFTAWLSCLAQCNLCDALRTLEAKKRGGSRRRVHARSDSESAGLLDVLGLTGTTPSRAAARDEVRAAVEEAVSSLPRDYRIVVQMYDLEGEPVQKVAAALHRSVGAVYMLRSRAHDRLHDLMGATTNYFSDSA